MKKLARGMGFGILVLACGSFGFAWRDIQVGKLPSRRAVGSLTGVQTTANLGPEQVFKQAYNQIRDSYYRPIKAEELKFAAMQGLMASLGDPHTMFLPPRAAEAFSEDTRANFSGIGARLQADPLGAVVVSVFEEGPANTAGMKAGDTIAAVDGKVVAGKAIDDIVSKIKGPEGTSVVLRLLRKGQNQPLELKIRRARVVTPTVESKYFESSQVGYVAVAQFSEPTAQQFDRAIAKLEKHTLKGLVIDLRGNPGGLLETAAEMLSRFGENKVVVKMRERGGQEEVVRTFSGFLHDFNYPIAVLINEDSASAAEIFSGCLRDYGKAKLIGQHSYGKASVQNVFQLVDRSSAKVTIAKYFLPSSGFIGRKVDEDGVYISGGLLPDIDVPLDMDKDPQAGDPKSDNQLARAIDFLTGGH
jgi:carboxyl-terminal processing protease